MVLNAGIGNEPSLGDESSESYQQDESNLHTTWRNQRAQAEATCVGSARWARSSTDMSAHLAVQLLRQALPMNSPGSFGAHLLRRLLQAQNPRCKFVCPRHFAVSNRGELYLQLARI